MAETAFIALGSNLGDREGHLEKAIQALQEHPQMTVTRVSTIYETEPVGGPAGQQEFLNAVVEVKADLKPRALLETLLGIEQKLGRVRLEKNGPRTIDLDLLLYGNEIIHEDGLEVPHPRLHLRSFVLEPLAEIAPQLVHPVLGVTAAKLWDDFNPDRLDKYVAEEETEPSPKADQSLTGARVLVTGSTGGMGRAIALEFARAGASVIVHGRRQHAADQVVEEIEELGGEAGVLLADLAELEECRRLVETAWEDFGPLDIWVNNAGADTLTGEPADWPFGRKLRALWEVDVLAAILMARDVGRRMKEQGQGVILNMGWDQADTGMEGDSGELFAAVKGAVMAFTKSLAKSLAPEVRVNCLAPGWIRTAWGEKASEFWQDRVAQETPLGRWGTPEDVAAAAVWLASPASSFITGQVIRVNGGAVRL